MNVQIGGTEPKFVLEVVNDPVRSEEARVQFERRQRNSDWLQQHWGDLLPQGLGKFVAVAGQEAFIADTPEEAWAWARRTHPEDNGVLVQYIRATQGPRECMQIVGEWLVCSDGVVRPVVLVRVQDGNGSVLASRFLVDSGADRTAFSAELLSQLPQRLQPAPAGLTLTGVGGQTGFVQVSTAIEFQSDDGGVATIRGDFAAFTDPAATDMGILGRDVLNNFDVITSRRRNEVLLLALNHVYRVERT